MGTIAKITSKGQVTIPLAVRQAMNLHTGDKIEFTKGETGKFTLVKRTRTLDELAGILSKYKLDHPIGREDIDAAIDEAMRERHFNT